MDSRADDTIVVIQISDTDMNEIKLRDGLATADRQGGVLVGAARQCLVDELVARQGGHRQQQDRKSVV